MNEIFNRMLEALLRWQDGEITSKDTHYLLKRELKKLNEACTCNFGYCCTLHKNHTMPHKGCIMR